MERAVNPLLLVFRIVDRYQISSQSTQCPVYLTSNYRVIIMSYPPPLNISFMKLLPLSKLSTANHNIFLRQIVMWSWELPFLPIHLLPSIKRQFESRPHRKMCCEECLQNIPLISQSIVFIGCVFQLSRSLLKVHELSGLKYRKLYAWRWKFDCVFKLNSAINSWGELD